MTPRLSVIGIGPGDPTQVTVEAIEAMNAVDVFFVVTKGSGKQELVDLRFEILRRYVRDPAGYRTVEIRDPDRDRTPTEYRATVAAWRTARADAWEAALREHLRDGSHGAFLAWGDPALYDSTLDVLADVRARGEVAFDQHVIPGISSVQILAARHGITLNRIGGAIEITPARRLADGLPTGAEDIVVMLNAGTAFTAIAEPGVHIYWGAYLGTPDELLIDGPLAEVAAEIERVRAEAKARKGWMFDTYLLRRAR
ncbi:MAG: precorrin-6A synthase (deacetylating) [Solirubrobacteraceae bacterium MAG38_C4-C5]|nr:precorrin-6A synthase (deacetylating) [Candidatus Siliceabacter maunaloa]